MAFDKNRSLDNDRYNTGPSALKAEDLGDSDAAVLTIADIDEASFDDPDAPTGKRYVLVLKSKEFPDKGFFCNKTTRVAVVERYGDTPSKWIGKQVPVIKVTVPNPKLNGKMVKSLAVAVDEDWDDIINEYSGVRTRGPRRGGKASGRGKKKATRRR